ncbi:MAG: OmpA family protein [Pseudorhodobacter sp.]|nr:OmpA family protein [Pseudorhodobacter sp.]
MRRDISESLRRVSAGFACAVMVLGGSAAVAQDSSQAAATVVPGGPTIAGRIDWGIWVDDDGCQHWWADGGLEGYMLDRVNPKTGKPVCLKKNTCLVENTDTLFATDSARLTAAGRTRLTQFFQSAGAFGYAIYGHTDSRASDSYNISLSQRRAASAATVARSVGAVVEREIGYGERQPIATNSTAAGMQLNRRVEVICYRW